LRLRLNPSEAPVSLESRLQRQDDGSFVISLEQQSDIADVVVAIRQAGVAVEELAILEPDLEEAFLKIMGPK
jgi:ABC-2 type transport system ATP-binding protein